MHSQRAACDVRAWLLHNQEFQIVCELLPCTAHDRVLDRHAMLTEYSHTDIAA